VTTTADAPGPDVESLGYEEARDELVDIVRRLESGNLPLEESLRLWERGEALAVRCQDWLAGARATIASARRPGNDPAGSPDAEAPGD
jgi:exodeoxyribonuclease VII small subunit